LVGFIAHLFVAWLRTGLASDLGWGVPGHDAPGDLRESQPPPQTAKMKFFRHYLWISSQRSPLLAGIGCSRIPRAHGYTRPAIEQGQAILGQRPVYIPHPCANCLQCESELEWQQD
jgi:hypothetical protein